MQCVESRLYIKGPRCLYSAVSRLVTSLYEMVMHLIIKVSWRRVVFHSPSQNDIADWADWKSPIVVPLWRVRQFLLFAGVLLLGACSSADDDDGGGLIGTGSGIINAPGLPIYHQLTEATPTSEAPGFGGDLMNFAPDGSLPEICPALLVSRQVEENVDWISPASAFLGNWLGTTSAGDALMLVVTLDDVAHGDLTASLSLRSNPALEIINIVQTDTEFSYSVIVSDAEDLPTDVPSNPFNERLELLGTDSLMYSIENAQYGNDTIQMTRLAPSDVLRPPAWMQGNWLNQCETRSITESDIQPSSTLGSVAIAALVDTKFASFRVNFLTAESYRYTATFRTETGSHLRFTETYESVSPNLLRVISGSTSKELSRN